MIAPVRKMSYDFGFADFSTGNRSMSPRYTLVLLVSVGCCLNLSCAPSAPSKVSVRQTPKDHVLGAGATFPDPLYVKWIDAYKEKHPKSSFLFQPVGSSEGVKRFLDRDVDFGASDAAMSDEEMAQVEEGVQLVPTAAGSIVLAYHLPDITELRLSRQTYVDIYLGKITSWDDEKIKADNPDLELPAVPIRIVSREDGSGTTYAFTNHLSAISEEWRDRGPGTTKLVDWSMETLLAGGNEGAARKVKETEGALGYIQYAMARDEELTMAWLENKAGNFVEPGHDSGFATLLAAPLPENMRAFFPDPEGAQSYPIVTYTWVMLYKEYGSQERLERLKDWVRWCLTDGQQLNKQLGYIALPDKVAIRAIAALDDIKTKTVKK